MYVIGIDGGGTKTTVALADLKGNILKKEVGRPSNLRNIGVKEACNNIRETIGRVVDKEEVAACFAGLASIKEEYKDQKGHIEEFLREITSCKNVEVESDQLVAFRAGTEKLDGIVVIAGTGSVVRGWNRGRDTKVGGWGFFADEGSAFWVGVEAFREVTKILDGRKKETILSNLLLKEWGIKSGDELNRKIYSDFTLTMPQLAILVDKASLMGDEGAINILKEAAKEILISVETVSKKLELEKDFPIVMSGGMLKSEVVREEFRKSFFYDKMIFLKEDPIRGAIKLAIKNYEKQLKKG